MSAGPTTIATALTACLLTILLPAAAPGQERDVRSKVEPPSAALPTARPLVSPRAEVTTKPAGSARLVRQDRESSVAIDVGATTDGVVRFVPDRYRNMSTEELRQELPKVEQAAARAEAGSALKQDLEDLVASVRIRIDTGMLPDDAIAQITSTVAELRDLPVRRPVRFRIIDREQLSTIINEKLNHELPPEYLPNYDFVLKLLGALAPREDLRKIIVSLLGEQVAGLYDKETGILYIMKQFDLNRSLSRIIVSHEICHAIQDQNFDLKRLPLTDPTNDDLNMAVASVVEGDATILMQDYMQKAITGKDLFQLVDVFSIDQAALNRAPHFLKQQLMFPYLTGAKFLGQISYDNPANRDRAFDEYPVSTEQVIHPEKYQGALRDDPTSFSVPDLSPRLGEGWGRIMQNVMGEMQIRTLFEHWREWDTAARIADGWDGDRYVLFRNGPSDYLFTWVSMWDTPEDAKDFYESISALMLNKRYKDVFGAMSFDQDDSIRVLKKKPGVDGPALHLRFRRDEKNVIVEITNSDAALAIVESLEESIFKSAAGEKIVFEWAKPETPRSSQTQADIDADVSETTSSDAETTAP